MNVSFKGAFLVMALSEYERIEMEKNLRKKRIPHSFTPIAEMERHPDYPEAKGLLGPDTSRPDLYPDYLLLTGRNTSKGTGAGLTKAVRRAKGGEGIYEENELFDLIDQDSPKLK